jgi:hypothetical protein
MFVRTVAVNLKIKINKLSVGFDILTAASIKKAVVRRISKRRARNRKEAYSSSM